MERPARRVVQESRVQLTDNPFKIGDEVVVKPVNARCTTPWHGPVQVLQIVDGTKVKTRESLAETCRF